MMDRSDVPPRTLPVEITPDSISIDYLDGRLVTYTTPPDTTPGAVTCPPGKHVHLLVTNEPGTEGVLVYLNDHRTTDDILESTGVGRVLITEPTRTEIFPGITAHADGHTIVVEADQAIGTQRVFVFAEDEFEERSYEILPE